MKRTLPEPKRRAADIAYEAIEALICSLELAPGSPVAEAEVVARTGLGRTPVREALLRMTSIGLIVQQPRRGLAVSTIDLGEYLDVLATRRVLERLIAGCAARRATAAQREQIVAAATRMVKAATRGSLADYMRADHELDVINHRASANAAAVKAVLPLAVMGRRFWYAYQHEGEMGIGAKTHLALAEGIASANERAAVAGAEQLMDYLERFARRVIDK